ncbi:MAG TPA: site-2 protease family protein [Solirubrobacterales bacterium]|nr:site-2 protease family protein [Solirubrobacterales bacterium]
MSWVLVVFGFAALVILHEAGHFVVAKATGMRVERFFLFFPPKLVSFRRGETEYGIGMIPLGGFVKITGMNPEELEAAEQGEQAEHKPGLLEQIEGADSGNVTPESIEGGGPVDPEIIKRAYYNQPVWKRIVVIAAGPMVNIVLAFILLTIVYLNVREPIGFQVDKVETGTPAAKVLKPGDRLISIDGVPARIQDVQSIPTVKRRLKIADYKNRHLSKLIGSHKCAGTPTPGCVPTSRVRLKIARDGKVLVVHPRTFYDAQRHRFRLGFQFGTLGTQTSHQSVGQAATLAADRMWQVTSQTVSKIAQLFNAADRKQLSGVVGTSSALNQAIDFSPRIALFVLALISLSLGVINLFPFLPLDGGHIFWSLVEKVRGRRVPFAWIERASVVGFLLVIMLFVIGLTNDIGRLTG